MQTAHIDIDRAEEFMKIIANACDDMIDGQLHMEGAFNDLHQNWNDVIFNKVGQQLCETGRGMQQVFGNISEPLDNLYLRCKKLCEEYLQTTPPIRYSFKDFTTKIQMEGTMGHTRKAAVNSGEVLDFYNELGRYIEEECDSMQKILNAHRNIHDDWNDPQYDKFDDEVRKFSAQFNNQMEALRLLRRLIYLRYEAIKEYEES